MMKKWYVAAIATVTALGLQAQAQTQTQTPAQGTSQPPAQSDRGSDKLDLKKLEDKYWSAKDADFSVVQNRTYSKAKKVFVSLGYGPLVNDAYSYGRMTNASVGYYFNERWGVEVAHEIGNLKDNDSTDAFINQNEIAPD